MRKYLLFTLCALLASYTALAESPSQPKAKGEHHRGQLMFDRMDTDNDGNITMEEHEQGLERMLAKRRAHFATMDKDGNGLVSKAEAMAAKAEMKEWVQEKRQQKESCPNQ